jgi:Ala-tRNA(Pro) deacylase
MANSTHTVFNSLLQLLEGAQAHFRVILHDHAGRSEEVAKALGTEVGQGAKALVCEVLGGAFPPRWALAVLPADRKLDRKRLASALGGTKARLADAEQASKLTGCVIGAIPPFSFNKDLMLVVDPELMERYDTIAFNAGRLDASILLDSQDFLAIAKPCLVRMSCSA